MTIAESSITLSFSDENGFRFQDCPAYRSLNNLKEMDACWYDHNNDILYLIELKDWGGSTLNEESDPTITPEWIKETKGKISKHRINELLKKSVDSVCMFSSILLDRPYGKKINDFSPFDISLSTEIKVLSIINWNETDTSYVSLINTSFKAKFNPYAKLFNIKTYLVLTKEQASRNFDWIS